MTNKSSKLAEEANDRERTGKTGCKDSKGTRALMTQLEEAGIGRGTETGPRGDRMMGKKKKKTGGVGRGRDE